MLNRPIFIITVLCGVLFFSTGIKYAQAQAYERRVSSDKLTDNEFDRAKDIIQNAEEYRGYRNRNFNYTAQIVDTLNKEVKGSSELEIDINYDSTEERSSIVRILSGNSAGQIIFQNNVNMWFYKTGTSNAFRISPAQRLLGGASYADVSSTNYTQNYDPVDMEELVVGNVPAYKITLSRVKKGVAYSTIYFYISRDDNRPIKSEFLTPSGKMLKSMFFRDFGELGGKTISREWIIVDSLNTDAVTYIRISDLKSSSLPSTAFSLDGIKKL